MPVYSMIPTIDVNRAYEDQEVQSQPEERRDNHIGSTDSLASCFRSKRAPGLIDCLIHRMYNISTMLRCGDVSLCSRLRVAAELCPVRTWGICLIANMDRLGPPTAADYIDCKGRLPTRPSCASSYAPEAKETHGTLADA